MTPRWYWRNRIRCRNRKMDRTNLNIWKRKNIPATTEIINRNKKTKFKHVIIQRNRGQFIRSLPMIKKNTTKISLVFHYFACIEKTASQLFCTDNIETINEAINIYEKYNKKFT